MPKKKPASKTWPEVLIEFRKKLDKTQVEMAAFVGVSRRIYVYWEHGRDIPELSQVGLACLIRTNAPFLFPSVPKATREKVQ